MFSIAATVLLGPCHLLLSLHQYLLHGGFSSSPLLLSRHMLMSKDRLKSKECIPDRLNENGPPHRLLDLNACWLGARIRRCGLLGGSVSLPLEVGLEGFRSPS